MTTNEERREAAKRKLEQRLADEQKAARKRTLTIVSVSTAVVLLVAGTAAFFITKKILDDREAARWTTCEYGDQEDRLKVLPTDPPAEVPAEQHDAYRKYAAEMNKLIEAGIPKKRTSPKPSDQQLKVGTQQALFVTNHGDIPVTLDHASAPCNTGAVTSLISDGFYDNTTCHRMTSGETLKVLQCGDPTATGAGGPGWSSPDEPPTDLEPVGEANPMTGQQAAKFPRGTIAIANSNSGGQSSNTGSSQFFIVLQDSQLAPDYSVVGHVDEAGLATLDTIEKLGITPGPAGEATDGAPKQPVEITKATLGASSDD